MSAIWRAIVAVFTRKSLVGAFVLKRVFASVFIARDATASRAGQEGGTQMKKRVLEPMPISEAVPRARLHYMGERASWRVLLDECKQGVVDLVNETTKGSVERFPVWRRLAVTL